MRHTFALQQTKRTQLPLPEIEYHINCSTKYDRGLQVHDRSIINLFFAHIKWLDFLIKAHTAFLIIKNIPFVILFYM